MLFFKPILLAMKHQNDPKPELKKPLLSDPSEGAESEENKALNEPAKMIIPEKSHGHGHEQFEFSEAFVHQTIETIEFILGKHRYLFAKQLFPNEFPRVDLEHSLIPPSLGAESGAQPACQGFLREDGGRGYRKWELPSG